MNTTQERKRTYIIVALAAIISIAIGALLGAVGVLMVGGRAENTVAQHATAIQASTQGPDIEASQSAPVEESKLRLSAWDEIEAISLCKSPSEQDVIVLIDPSNALAETWLLVCDDGRQEAYKVEYVPTISGASFTVTKMAQP